jgi:hypothetical protein
MTGSSDQQLRGSSCARQVSTTCGSGVTPASETVAIFTLLISYMVSFQSSGTAAEWCSAGEAEASSAGEQLAKE